MASYEKDLPAVPSSRTPSLYTRLKAVGHRALKSRNEERYNTPSRDLHARPSSSAAPSGRPSVSHERESRSTYSQARSSTTSPEQTRKRIDVSKKSRRPQPQSSEMYLPGVEKQQQPVQQKVRTHLAPQPHIAYQAIREPAHDHSTQLLRAQTARPDVPYPYQAPIVPLHGQYEANVYYNFPQPQTSQRMLRRKPSIIADYVSESRAGLREDDEALMQSPETSPEVSKTSLRRPNQTSPSVQRRTPESVTSHSLRHPARALVTPDSSRSYSRAAMDSSITPSSPSTYRHDTPSIFSHASRATSRTAYTPSSATPYMEAQTWNEFPVPPLPDLTSKRITPATTKQPFIPPELAHLAYSHNEDYVSKSEHNQSVRAGLDALTSKPAQSPELTRHAMPKARASHLTVDEQSRSPIPLSAMDPALRSRVTLNTTAADLTLPHLNKLPKKVSSRSTNARQPVAKSTTRSAGGSVAANKSSTTNAAVSPRLSLDKPRPSLTHSFRRPSFTAKNSPRLSFQCQGSEEAAKRASEDRAPEDRARSSSVASQHAPPRAQHSRAFSFSKTGLKTKSSIESLKTKFSFAQRMFMKSATCIPSIAAESTATSEPSDPQVAIGATSRGESSKGIAASRDPANKTASREVDKGTDSVTPSSRPSIDRARQNATARTISRLPETVKPRDSLSKTGPSMQHDSVQLTAKAVRRKPVPVTPEQAVRAPALSTGSQDDQTSSSAESEDTVKQNNSNVQSTANTGRTSGEEFLRFSTITGTRISSASSSSSSEASPAPLSRLHSADSGNSTGLAGYGLFPKTKPTSPSTRPIVTRQPSSPGSAQVIPNVAQVAVARTASISTVGRQRAAVSLRLGALTASTAITGKALFSPADIQLTQGTVGEKALVMDGSGEDWSLYCATIYPLADIFNLPLTSPQPTMRDELTKLRGLTNHKEVPHSFLAAQFPLPSNHFSVVVLRFPPAMDEALLRHIIAESKRVLRPGGYIEIIAMDLDLAKMGSDTRRAVRDHKIQMHHTNSNVCLKPASDNLQRLLAHRGFENLKSGLILLPAASENVEPTDRAWLQKHNEAQPHPRTSTTPSENTFLPAEVGRWWYKQSYEGYDTSTSIWQDPLVLRECARLQTSFKLLMCYAQKPTIVKRRTVSL